MLHQVARAKIESQMTFEDGRVGNVKADLQIKEVEMVQGTAVAVEGGVHLTLDTDTGPSSHDSPSTIQLLCLDRDLRLGLFAPG